MFVLLPPSETKADGGRGKPLVLENLLLPELTDIRTRVANAIVELAADPQSAQRILGISASQAHEVERNARLWAAPTQTALTRYTGVLYDALDVKTLTRAQLAKAHANYAIGSALFGAVGAGDLIPAYRLSGGTKLPEIGTLTSVWKPMLTQALETAAGDRLVVDLRSGAYQQLGKVPGAVTVTVLTEAPDGSRSVVSHFNKHHKGVLARVLLQSRAEPHDIAGLARVARKAGLRVEISKPSELILLTD
ncbi:MAG: peroxide stress protein YaaA [Nocardiaceae bacterium]|nr:peroxide stress protein YaaA [Nocardiaceae bacterium]